LDIPRPVIVEGCVALRLLSSIGRKADFTSPPDGGLEADLAAYDTEFSPRDQAGLVLALDDEGRTGCESLGLFGKEQIPIA
jgi:hypothetical protein